MIVRFDSLNRFEAPKFVLCNPGSVYYNGLTTNTVGALIDKSDEEILFNFNSPSELRFRANKVLREDKEENEFVRKLYGGLQNRRLVFVEDIGYFLISNVEDGYDGEREYKDITAQSCEVEIQRKNLTYIEDGTYKFDVLLELIVSTLPKWTIGHVDFSVLSKYRTFEDVDTEMDTLSFLLNDVQDAYECIFIFDIINRRINVYDQSNYVVRTDIHITKEDLIQNLRITENAEDLYTAVSVFGDESLNIAAINPLGTNTIYNFDYYLDWMSPALKEKVVAWTKLQKEVFDTYYDLNLKYYVLMTERTDCEAEKSKLAIVRDTYKRCRENIVATSSSARVERYNEVIAENGGTPIDITDDIDELVAKIDEQITTTETSISTVEDEINSINTSMEDKLVEIEAIHKSVAITTYFSQEEYDELYDYIFEGNYRDEYITVTESMTHVQRFEQMKTLYDRAVGQLKKISVPTQEFAVDVENFLFAKEFEPWSNQLETGCLINVEFERDDVAALFLASITVNYAERSLSFTFGNRYNRFDARDLFDDVLGNISKSSNTIDYVKDLVYPIKSGELNAFAEALKNSRVLTMHSALASTNQDVYIDDSGYTGRKLLGDGSFDPRQIKITNNTIVFTSDEWESSDTAIGEIILGNNKSIYGINAKAVIGEMIIGGQLNIYDKDGNELLSVVDGKISASVSDKVTQTGGDDKSFGWSLLPDGFRLTASGEQVFYASDDGVEIVGSITAISGTIGGCEIKDNILRIKNANIAEKLTADNINADGIVAKNVDITGAITATSGVIGGCSITNGVLKIKNANIDEKLTADNINANGMTATNVTITGNITATSGTIGGCAISSGVLQIKNANIAEKLTASKIDATNLKVAAANITGTLTASSISVKDSDGDTLLSAGSNAVRIAGWNVDSNSLYYGSSFSSATCFICTGSNTSMSIGGSGSISGWVLKAGSNFGVTNTGALYARNAKISGSVTATSGDVGGWTINNDKLSGTYNGYTIAISPIGVSGYYTNASGSKVPVTATWDAILTAALRWNE